MNKDKEELPERRKNDFYPTPFAHARRALDLWPRNFEPKKILDPGSGDGVWGRAAWDKWPNGKTVTGYEIRQEAVWPKGYGAWFHRDFLTTNLTHLHNYFDLVMGNPPYRYAEEFVRKSIELLKPKGHLIFMLRLAFLESQKRLELWDDHPLKEVAVCANRPSFTGDGKTNATAFAFYHWVKGYRGVTKLSWAYSDKDYYCEQ
jgi:SAM-dependent methyltransferase